MDLTTLKKANDLDRKITEFQQALNCFEYQPYCDDERKDVRVSTNPSLIIEFDDCDGRAQIALPMNLSDFLIDLLKAEIKNGLDKAEKEFSNLKC